MLRDIIGDLENQIETRTQHEAALEQQLQQLHTLLEQQGRTHQELTDEVSYATYNFCAFFVLNKQVRSI
jgi:type II secretory pathway predicted ATPase ExeA